jgi:hypothetical protein
MVVRRFGPAQRGLRRARGMSRCSTTTANSAAGHDGIVAGVEVLAPQRTGVDPTAPTDPAQILEEQW